MLIAYLAKKLTFARAGPTPVGNSADSRGLACQQTYAPALDLSQLLPDERSRYPELRNRANIRPKT